MPDSNKINVEFTLNGQPFSGLNGGMDNPFTEAVSFTLATNTQEEADKYWNALTRDGGEPIECGWCKDKWGFNWQITPRILLASQQAGGEEARRAFEAMMTMTKIDVAAIDAARRG